MKITPKHFAREFNVPAQVVRMMLRAKYAEAHRLWCWEGREAAKVRRWLAKSLGREAVK